MGLITDTEAQRELQASVATFVAKELPIGRLRALRDTPTGFDHAAFRRMADLGWLSIVVPEDHGGLGLGAAEAAVVVEALAAAAATEPVTSTTLAARLLAFGDNATLASAMLPRIGAGAVRAAVAWQERVGVIDATDVAVRAAIDDGAAHLTGIKRFVAHGGDAHVFIVSARDAGGIGLWWVPADVEGLRYAGQKRADGTEHGTLHLADVRVPESNRIAGNAGALLARALDEATVCAAAELLGIASRTLEVTLAHLRTRVQFGKPIGTFQALQHRAVDHYIRKELAVSALGAAFAALGGADTAARAMAVSRAKARAGDAALEITRDAVQMHGAMGYTDECDVGLYLKRALTLSAWLGNAVQHRRRYAALAPRTGD
jgi:alkylation response protein AidB-like acyl-CoA dehydrogenase